MVATARFLLRCWHAHAVPAGAASHARNRV